jgi:hypothetical protein
MPFPPTAGQQIPDARIERTGCRLSRIGRYSGFAWLAVNACNRNLGMKGAAHHAARKVLVAQGGGPTAVINQSMAGVVLEARKFRNVELVYGAYHGVSRHRRRGVPRPDAGNQPQHRDGGLHPVLGARLDARQARPQVLPRDIRGPQGARHRLLFLHRRQRFLGYGAHRQRRGPPRRTIPCAASTFPKTIDNDLVGNDHTPGFPSAARFVAQAFMGANLDNAALPGVYLAVVMGRHAGFLTAASALGKKFPDDGPHLIYLPERVFEVEKFLRDVKKPMKNTGVA